MSSADRSSAPSLFQRTLDECRQLYLSCGRLVAERHPQLLAMSGEKYVALMDDLHKALVLKVYVSVCEADREWTADERRLAETLFTHLWGTRITGDKLCESARQAASQSAKIKWYSIVRPFEQLVPLHDCIGSLETIVMRLAHLIARCDGRLDEREAAAIKSIQDELRSHLCQVPINDSNEDGRNGTIGAQAVEQLGQEADEIRAAMHPLASKNFCREAVDTRRALTSRSRTSPIQDSQNSS